MYYFLSDHEIINLLDKSWGEPSGNFWETIKPLSNAGLRTNGPGGLIPIEIILRGINEL